MLTLTSGFTLLSPAIAEISRVHDHRGPDASHGNRREQPGF